MRFNKKVLLASQIKMVMKRRQSLMQKIWRCDVIISQLTFKLNKEWDKK
jgi:hypothetical protein